MKKVSMVAMGLMLTTAHFNANAVEATDGTISFTGNIASQTCKVSVNGGSSSASVPLPKVAASVLNDADTVAGITPFTLALTECSSATGNVYAYFEQGENVNDNGRLKNTGDATNVDIQLLDSANKVVKVGSAEQSTAPASIALNNGAGVMTYYAQYYATAAAQAGSVASSVSYSINYL